jgi:putative phosphoesterase
MLISVIADTHIKAPGKDLPQVAYEWIRKSDAVIHAGDLVNSIILDRLNSCVPAVYAVLGNNDYGVKLPLFLEIQLENVPIAVIHDSGPRDGRRKRMLKQFPNARIVVYGHSHIPDCSDEDGLLLLNPGSPTDKRRQPVHTMGLLRLNDGDFVAEIVNL